MRRIVPQSYVMQDGFKLGLWQTVQRRAYKKGVMPTERIERLEARHPYPFVLPPPPPPSSVYPSPPLSSVFPIRYPPTPPPPHPHPTPYPPQAAGIVWDPHELAWEEGFKHFSAFEEDVYGKRNVPTGFRTEGGYNLGLWLENQRQARKKVRHKIKQQKALHTPRMFFFFFPPICHDPFFPYLGCIHDPFFPYLGFCFHLRAH